LTEAALPLLRDARVRKRMGEAAQTLARPNAAADLARVLLHMGLKVLPDMSM